MTVSAFVWYFRTKSRPLYFFESSDLTSLLGTALGALVSGVSGGKLGSGQGGSGGSLFNPAILGFILNNNLTLGEKPNAFLNRLFLDEPFGYKQGN